MPAATKGRRIVHQKAKGPVDPSVGHKVRELRMSRGMTQAQLAGSDFSKGFISLLETGRTRASLRAAEIIAGRLGVDVTDLLSAPSSEDQDVEFMLLRAEQALRSGDVKTTIDIAAKWAAKSSGVLKARFQRLHGRALIRSTRTIEAVKVLDEALRAFRGFGAKEYAARALFDLAIAHGRVRSFGEAIRYALETEHAIERGDIIDRTLELEIHQFLASAYLGIGDAASAEIRAERARSLAEDIANPMALAGTYEALSLARYNQGDREAALVYARKSIEIYETLGHAEKLAETWNTLGWLFIRREQYGKAAEALDRADKIAREADLTRLAPWIIVNRSALALGRGNAAEARRFAEEAAASDGQPRVRARSLLLRARSLAASGGSTAEVKRAFEEAIRAHEDEPPSDQARAYQLYADALAQRGQKADAFDQAQKALELVGPKI